MYLNDKDRNDHLLGNINIKSLLNRMGCMVTVITWVCGLRGSVGPWFVWVKFLHGLHGSKYFLHRLTFYVGPNFYVGCVRQIYFCESQNFLHGSFHGS